MAVKITRQQRELMILALDCATFCYKSGQLGDHGEDSVEEYIFGYAAEVYSDFRNGFFDGTMADIQRCPVDSEEMKLEKSMLIHDLRIHQNSLGVKNKSIFARGKKR